jgi:acyl-CoA thioester hydrolase
MTSPLFSLPVRVYYEDTDAGGVVYHASYLRFAERARTEWLRNLGFDQRQIRTETGTIIVVRSAHIDYLKPALLDDALSIECQLQNFGKTRMTMHQRVMRGSELCAQLEIGLVCVDAKTIRPAPWPQPLVQVFAPLLPHQSE